MNARMNAIEQLEQNTTQVCSGIQNVLVPRPQLLRESEQFISEALSNFDFPVCLPIVSKLSPSPSIMQTKEIFQATNMVEGILITGLANAFISTTKSDRKFMLDHIDIGGKTLLFTEPIIGNVSFNDDLYSCKNEYLDIISMSPNLEDCIKDFKDEVLFVWNEYGKEDDSKLTNGAKKLKKKISRYINK